MVSQALTILLLVVVAVGCKAFIPTRTTSHTTTSGGPIKKTALTRYAFSSGPNDYAANSLLNNVKRTCIQQFLSQRSLQSFMFLLTEVRDPHTSDWIERFLDAPSLLEYHGTGAFNMTRFDHWDTYFLEMMKLPNEIIIIEARKRGSVGGGSKNNPFLKQDHLFEYTIDIHPSSLVPRIMAVREQIAREFVTDVDLVRIANDQILISYENKVRRDVTCTTFDRNAMMMLNNNMAMAEFAPSPLRKGNFDLLMLLSLHESVHRVLREYNDLGDEKEVSFAWLRDYFVDRVDFFDGCQRYGRADDFIEEMLMTAPTMKNTATHTELVDPLAITSDILRMRSEVLLDWKDIVARVPADHMGLKKSLLTQQSMGWAADRATEAATADSDMRAFE